MVLAGTVLVLGAAGVVVLLAGDPFGGSTKPGGSADNTAPTSLATVRRQTLSSQTQVSATLGYAGARSIRIPTGTPPSSVQQGEESVRGSEHMVQGARAALAADGATLANLQATVAAKKKKAALDCGGDGAAEGQPNSPSQAAEAASTGSPSEGGSEGVCASDVQALGSEEQSSSAASSKLSSDRSSLSSAQGALASAEAALRAARSGAADYGQGATFTMLAKVGQVIGRGQSLFALSGQPTVLLYGSVIPSRSFLAGMSAGADVGALNANLEALGYGGDLGGDTFSTATEAAIRAFQSARGMTATGELPLGSVVFEGERCV